jgi:hypothetical protein
MIAVGNIRAPRLCIVNDLELIRHHLALLSFQASDVIHYDGEIINSFSQAPRLIAARRR